MTLPIHPWRDCHLIKGLAFAHGQPQQAPVDSPQWAVNNRMSHLWTQWAVNNRMSHLWTQWEMHRLKWMKALHQFRLTTYINVSNYNYLYLMLLIDHCFKYKGQGFILSKTFLCCSTRLPVSVHKCRFYGRMFNWHTNYCYSDGCCAYVW